jgi:hypothetical protein
MYNMNIVDYYKICNICDNILLDEKSTETTIAIPLLHVVRDHPIFINQYDSIFIKNIEKNKFNYLLLVKYFISLLLSFIKGKFIINKYWVSSNKLKKSYDFIFISHLLNEDQAGDNRDFYYDYLPRDLSNLGYTVLVVLLNHTTKRNENLICKWQSNDVTRLILSKQTGVLNEIRYYTKYIKEAFRLKKLYKNESDILKKKIIKLAINQVRPTINNLQFALQFNKISKLINPKNAIITYEGHAWERLAFSNLRKYSNTKCFAYQHALIFKNQYAIKRNLQDIYNPNIILTSGTIGKDILKSCLNNIKIDVLGSNRAISDSISNTNIYNNKCILVLPEGTKEECLLLFEHSYKCAVELPDVKFIWRLHPLMKFKDLESQLINFNSIPKNIKLSSSTLNQDIIESNFVLYRGTTAVINCVMNGLRPIYLIDNDNFNIDPLHEINDYKFIVYKSDDTINLLNSFTDFNKIKLDKNNLLMNHASKLFTALDINKLIEHKN